MARSTWYHNLNALNRQDKYCHIKQKIKDVYFHHKGRYGYRRITIILDKTRDYYQSQSHSTLNVRALAESADKSQEVPFLER